MKKVILFLLLTVGINTFAQDLIVTTQGDSINCRITKEKGDYIYFAFKQNDEIRNTLITNSEVKYHQLNYFEDSQVKDEDLKKKVDYQQLRIAINGGYSYRTAKLSDEIPSDLRDYVKKLKNGYHLSGDITYFFSEPLGAGLKLSYFNASNSVHVISPESTGYTSVEMSDDIDIFFIGPSINTRFYDKNKRNAFLMSMAIGYMDYTDNGRLVNSVKISGSTLGVSFDMGYDVYLSDNFSLGFQLGFLAGTLNTIEQFDGVSTTTVKLEENQYENLARIDFSVGLRFNK
nr:DUF3575 domain-containing protein [uncultured Carboxylicivirga sp.]